MNHQHMRFSIVLSILLLSLLLPFPARAGFRKCDHPFILWNKKEAAAIRKRIETEDWAKKEFESLPTSGRGEVFANLLKVSVMGDGAAGKKEKDYLLSFIGAKVDSRPWSDNYLTALRYDIFYNDLTDDQRRKLEDTFRKHIDFEVNKDKKTYTRTSWLPNMQWCRKMSVALMAVAMQDKDAIVAMNECNGGWKYYLDDYISDGRFYNEEFGKQYSMNGEMLLWCRGLERLGLDDLGYGYVGKPTTPGQVGGATMQRYLASYFDIGMPRVDLGTDRYHYPHMSMGDAKGSRGLGGAAYPFQQVIVTGCLANGEGGQSRWSASNMNGRDHKDRIIDKLAWPLWFEIAHVKWPDAHFDYFLAQMRAPDQDKYFPSLYFGCDPIDPAKVAPPPAPSGAYPERGIAVLRAEEGPGFWASPAPAVGVRWATDYVHSAKDSFTLTGFYAFNRPIYVNRQVSPGYAGTDPTWSANIRGHSGVMVDAMEPRFTGVIPLRSHFSPQARFVAGTAEEVYPGVVQTRALVLTREYLFDVFALRSNRPRSYFWQVQGLGRACPDNPSDWAETRHLVGLSPDIRGEMSCVVDDQPWAVTLFQRAAGADPDMSALGERWFKDPPGVRVHMLGEPGTIAYTGWGPAVPGIRDRMLEGRIEPGGHVVAAARNKAATVFAALHEPFKKQHRVLRFRRVAEGDGAVIVAVEGTGINDRIMVRYEGPATEPVTLTGSGESYTFTGYAHLRIGRGSVDAVGNLAACRVEMPASKALRFELNGNTVKAVRDGRTIAMGDPAAVTSPLAAALGDPPPPPIEAFWHPGLARLATGGKQDATLVLRNAGLAPAAGKVTVRCTEGLHADPATLALDRMAPGEERRITVTISGDADHANRLGLVDLAPNASAVKIQNAPLKVAHGVCLEWEQVWPRQQTKTIYAPRYVAQYEFLERSAATYLLDPLGIRRYAWSRRDGSETYPRLRVYRPPRDDRNRPIPDAKPTWQDRKLGQLLYWSPVKRGGGDGEPAYFIESGTHPHQPTGVPLEYRWTEDWILCWHRFEGEKISVDWSSSWGYSAPLAGKLKPGAVLAHTGEKIEPAEAVTGKPVRALFRRTAGYTYGEATFYPEGSILQKQGKKGFAAESPGDDPVAFTYCTEEEFPTLVEKWTSTPPPPRARPKGQGDRG